MRPDQFQNQLGRLVEQFGKASYGTERSRILWQEVQGLEERWFSVVVDRFLGESRQAPLLPDFREEILRERERLWRIEKDKNSQDAKDFFNSSYQADDVKTLCEMITKRLRGGVSDTDYKNFESMLDNVASNNPKTQGEKLLCKRCGGDGLVFQRGKDGNECVYRCSCPSGSKQSQKYAVCN